MVKDARFTYTTRHTYRTRSNRLAPVKTPGGRIVGHKIAKATNAPACGDCHKRNLHGIPALRRLNSVSRTKLSVTRSYGGSRCASCVRRRILRAFLQEEKKAVKKVIQAKNASAKKGGKKSKA